MKTTTIVIMATLMITFCEKSSWGNEAADQADVEYLSKGPEPVVSSYSATLDKLLTQWPLPGVNYSTTDPLQISRIQTPGNPFAIGVQVTMLIDAPMERVEHILDDKGSYWKLFTSFSDIHVVHQNSEKPNEVLTYWEKSIPIILVPNARYILSTAKDVSVKSRIIYRTKLMYGNYVKYNDGALVIERDPQDKNKTRYTEYSFYDADWGLAKTLCPGRIWKESIKGFINSDITIKLKAEHEDWDLLKIFEQRQYMSDVVPIDATLESHIELDQTMTVTANNPSSD